MDIRHAGIRRIADASDLGTITDGQILKYNSTTKKFAGVSLAIGTDVQAYDADLSAIAALSHADGNFMVSNGSAWTSIGTLGAVAITQTGTSGNGLYVLRDLASGSTDGPLVHINNTNASDDQTAVEIAQDGSGAILDLKSDGVTVLKIPAGMGNGTDGQVLTTDGDGVTSWQTATSEGAASSVAADNISAGDAAVTVSTTVGAVNITPASGSAIVLDGAINIDAGVVTGATSITSTAFVGNLTGTSSKVTVTDNESTDENNLITFIEDASAAGNVGLESDGDFHYNPSSGTVTATIFKGNIDAVDGDFDGTLEADAITVGGVALSTYIRDAVGTNMLSSNTESGITVTYDTSNDNIDFAIDAAQTGITSILATDLKIGEDNQTKIDFETADEIHFYAANVEQVYLADNIFGPQSDSDVDLGSTSVRWKDAFVDSITVTGEIDGASLDISGNADIDGTLEADAYTVDGVALNEYIADTVGAMVGSNTESGITVAYQDGDNTLDFTVGTLNQDTTGTAAIATTVTITDNESANEDNAIVFTAGGDVDGGNLGLESDGDLHYNPSTGTVTATIFKGNIDAVDGDFDGTLEADAITLGGTALGSLYSPIAGSSSIVTVGTIGAGTWQGTTIAVNQGGTGATTLNNLITLGTHTTGNYVATIADAGNSAITVANSGSETAAITLDIADNAVGIAELAGIARGKIIVGDASGNPALLAAGTEDYVLTMDSNGDAVWAAASGGGSGDITAVVAGTGLSGGATSGSATLNVDAAQSGITSLGTLTALTVDDVAVDGKVITMTGSSSDTAVFTAGTNGTLSIVTTDAAAAAANIQITADGTVDIDSAGILTLDSGAAINIEPAAGSAILLDGTISIDAGVVTGATSITSTAFVGDITGDVTGNADTATALAAGRTIGMTGDVVWTSASFTGAGNVTGSATIQANSVDGTMIALGSDAAGDIMYNNGTDYVRLAKGSDDEVLTLASGVPSWATASSGGMSAFIIEDDDGTEVSISNAEEIKFIGSGITTNWTDTTPGSDGDPFDMTFTVDAAQTGITSLLATDIKIGEDDQTKIDFETANEIHFYANNVEQVYLADNIFGPQSDSDVDLGTTGVRWKDAYVDSITVTGEIDGNSLDIEGDADINGTLEADAITIGGTALSSVIAGTTVVLAVVAASVSVADTESTDEDDNIAFVRGGSAASGNVSIGSDGDFHYNPSTGTVTATIFKGNIDAVDGDFDGTLEADAITVDGVALATYIRDTVGTNMLSSNTESGIAVTYDTSNDNIDFAISAAQTGITSLLAADIKIGEDDQTKIDFETADEIHFYAANVEQVYLADNIFGPQSDSDVDLGSTGVRWKDAYVDSITVTGEIDGDSLDIEGDADINGTLEADAITLGGTALGSLYSPIAGSSSILTVGTIGTGTWQGTTIAVNQGGTGATSLNNLIGIAELAGIARGKIIVGDASGDPALLAAGDEDQVLTIDSNGDAVWATASSGGMSAFILEDDDGTEVSISNAEEIKFIGSGITTNWTDTTPGSDGDPFDMTFTVDAAQTGITSLLATDIKIGEDDQTKIDFETADEIHFYAANVHEVSLVANVLQPATSDGVALGTGSLMWSDLFLASGSVVNFNNGDVTLTHSGNTLTVAGGTLATAALTASTGTFSGVLKTDDTTDATSTTDGSLQTDGGLSVAKDCILGNDVKLLTDSSVLSLGIGSDATFTHDGTTGITIAANPITLDSAAAINIDAGNGIINLQDSGSTVLSFTEGNSGDVTIKLVTNGKDLVFTDNGDATNMKILDAAAGINVPGEVQTTGIGYTDGDNAMTIADGGKVTFAAGFAVGSDAAGDILYHNGTSYIRLAKGDDDEVLTLASGVPSWAAASGGGSGDITGVTLAGDSSTAQDLTANVNLTLAGGNGITTAGDGSATISVALDAALTTVTSLLAADIKIGEDDQTKIDFETADEIHFYANNVEQVYLADNIFGPQSDSDVDLGTTGVRWKDAYIDTITTTGKITLGGSVNQAPNTATDGGAVDIDCSTSNYHEILMNADATSIVFTNATAGQRIVVRFKQHSSHIDLDVNDGWDTVTVNGSSGTLHWAGGIEPTLTESNNAIDVYGFLFTSTVTTVHGFIIGQDIKA